jgi:hypothetical protein
LKYKLLQKPVNREEEFFKKLDENTDLCRSICEKVAYGCNLCIEHEGCQCEQIFLSHVIRQFKTCLHTSFLRLTDIKPFFISERGTGAETSQPTGPVAYAPVWRRQTATSGEHKIMCHRYTRTAAGGATDTVALWRDFWGIVSNT